MIAHTFLGFAERRPHLQAIDLPGEPRLRHVKAKADDADAAFTRIWIREGWLAINSHQELWSLPIPMTGDAKLLSDDWDVLPADDGRTVWIQHPDGGSWVRVDGNGSISGPSLVRQPGERLEAVYGQAAIVRAGGAEALWLRRPGTSDLALGNGVALCQAGAVAFVSSQLGAALSAIDLKSGRRVEIPRVGFGCWGLFASASPDESIVAIGCDLASAPPPRPPGMPYQEWLGHPDNPRRTDYRNVMVLIDVHSMSTRVLNGVFDNFASAPAWSTSGEGFVFSIPFERNTCAWVDRRGEEIIRIRVPRRSPTPLCDATELVGRGID